MSKAKGWVSEPNYTSIAAAALGERQKYHPDKYELIVADGSIPSEGSMHEAIGARIQEKAYLWLYDRGVLSVVFIGVSLTHPENSFWTALMFESEGPIAPLPSNEFLALPVTNPNKEWRHSLPFFPLPVER